jgi:bacterial/archaeal transporter family protein
MKQYQLFAFYAMIFAGLTSVIAKAGLKNVSGDTGLAVRTSFVFVLIWLNIFIFNHTKDFGNLTKKDVFVLCCSGRTTSLSWIFYYKAIKIGNVSEVAFFHFLKFSFLAMDFNHKIHESKTTYKTDLSQPNPLSSSS